MNRTFKYEEQRLSHKKKNRGNWLPEDFFSMRNVNGSSSDRRNIK